jgi:hypothetical protein
MSLAIVSKGPEGIVLAADSRATLQAVKNPPPGTAGPLVLLPSTFDNATKLLKVKGQDYVAAVTYGLGAIGHEAPRSPHSFLPEIEEELITRHGSGNRLTVQQFAEELSGFFMRQWQSAAWRQPPGDSLNLFVAGYDEGAVYGRVFKIAIPDQPDPKELIREFGAVWGGQREFVDRLLQGYDSRIMDLLQPVLGQLPDWDLRSLLGTVAHALRADVPWQFLPLQDCVDLAIFLIRMTMRMQKWTIGIRGVGGAIDVATITRTDGFHPVQIKRLTGQRIYLDDQP